jgi:hypothetical protein
MQQGQIIPYARYGATDRRSSYARWGGGLLTGILSVIVLSVAGCSDEVTPRRQLGPNPASIGFLDAPAPETTVDPVFTVAGWAIDESGVQRVRIYLDDELIASVPLTVLRPDIVSTYPTRARAGLPHGFSVLVDAGIQSGYRRVRLEAIDGRGAATQIATANVKIES